MEETGGEPDVIGCDAKTGEFLFVDCAPQSPAARQSLCYDRAALDGRKKFPPKGCVTELAASIGIELLDEAQYLALQQLGEFDTKTSSWLKTPPESALSVARSTATAVTTASSSATTAPIPTTAAAASVGCCACSPPAQLIESRDRAS